MTVPSALFAVSAESGLARQLDRVCRTQALRGARGLADGGKLTLEGVDEVTALGVVRRVQAGAPSDEPAG